MTKKYKPTFKEVSQLASEVEQAGDYDYAATLWEKAATLARKAANVDWCIKRVEFLTRWGVRLREAKE